MPELKYLAKIDVKMHVTEMNKHYDFILGQESLTKIGIVLYFGKEIVTWVTNPYK